MSLDPKDEAARRAREEAEREARESELNGPWPWNPVPFDPGFFDAAPSGFSGKEASRDVEDDTPQSRPVVDGEGASGEEGAWNHPETWQCPVHRWIGARQRIRCPVCGRWMVRG